MKKTITLMLVLALAAPLSAQAVMQITAQNTTDSETIIPSQQQTRQQGQDQTIEIIDDEVVSDDLADTLEAVGEEPVKLEDDLIISPTPLISPGSQGNIQIQPIKVRNATELKSMIKAQRQVMNEEVKQVKPVLQEVHQNQNRVREAVQALLAAEYLVGGIGPQVSEIAREFNNSVQNTIQAEEQIQTRSRFTRFLLGGNQAAAQLIQQTVNENQERLQELRDLNTDCDCLGEVKEVLQEQVQNLEQEQERLQQVATKELKVKGLFGWVVRLFKKN